MVTLLLVSMLQHISFLLLLPFPRSFASFYVVALCFGGRGIKYKAKKNTYIFHATHIYSVIM